MLFLFSHTNKLSIKLMSDLFSFFILVTYPYGIDHNSTVQHTKIVSLGFYFLFW